MDDDSATMTVVNHDLQAYRPQTEGPGYGNPFPKTAVPSPQEEDLGVGIRRNGDDDDADGVDDLDPNDTAITGENDLIEVDFMMPTLPGIQYVLKRTNANINVFAQRDKGGAALLDDSDTDNEEVVVCNATGGACGAWIEWATMEAAQTQSILTLEVRTKTNDTRTDGKLTLSDKLKFYPFTSVVIALGGEEQEPGDPLSEPDNFGTFQAAIDEYLNGYDVHMYDEDVVAWSGGTGAAYDEVVSAIEQRGVTQVAIFGYSHGGGATYELASRVHRNTLPQIDPEHLNDITNSFTMPYTSYIDAITQETAGAENRRPPMSGFHLNQYQQNTGAFTYLNGGSSNGDDDIDRSNLTDANDDPVVHTTIDDHSTVLDFLKLRLEQKISR